MTDNNNYTKFTTFKLKDEKINEFLADFLVTKNKIQQTNKQLVFTLQQSKKKFLMTESLPSQIDYFFHSQTNPMIILNQSLKQSVDGDITIEETEPSKLLIDPVAYNKDKTGYTALLKNFIRSKKSDLRFSVDSWDYFFTTEESEKIKQILTYPPYVQFLTKIDKVQIDTIRQIGRLESKICVLSEVCGYKWSNVVPTVGIKNLNLKRPIEDTLQFEEEDLVELYDPVMFKKNYEPKNENQIKLDFITWNKTLLDECLETWIKGENMVIPMGCHLYKQTTNTKHPCQHDKKYFICISDEMIKFLKTDLQSTDILLYKKGETNLCLIDKSKLVYSCQCGVWKSKYNNVYEHRCPFKFNVEYKKNFNSSGFFTGFLIKISTDSNPHKKYSSAYSLFYKINGSEKKKLEFTDNIAKIDANYFLNDLDKKQKIQLICCTESSWRVFHESESYDLSKEKFSLSKSTPSIEHKIDNETDELIRILQKQLKTCSLDYVLFLYCCILGVSLDHIFRKFRITKKEIIDNKDKEENGEGKNGIFWYITLNNDVDTNKLQEEFKDFSIEEQFKYSQVYKNVNNKMLKLRIEIILKNYRYGFENTIFDLIASKTEESDDEIE
eukprot:gene12105-5597_t